MRTLCRSMMMGLFISLALAGTGCPDVANVSGLTERGIPNVVIPIEGDVQGELAIVPAFPNLDQVGSGDNSPIGEPIDIMDVPGTNRMAVVRQAGQLVTFPNNPNVTRAQVTVLLDLGMRVGRVTAPDESGLLGCDFDQDFATNGFFYCYYTAAQSGRQVGVGRLSRFRNVGSGTANAAQEQVLLEVEQPQTNHNGGDVIIGPDGFLYLSLGDGGGFNDLHGASGDNNAQNLRKLLGSLIRIDPGTGSVADYQIPSDNPFGTQKCPTGVSPNQQPCGEIFHWGLRHPWRFSFDALTGNGFIGDVGQGAQEEVDFWRAGESGINYGWACREGTVAGPAPNLPTCDSPAERRDPIDTFPTRENPSVIGGYVYRGADVPQLQGLYVYAGFNPGVIRIIDQAGNRQFQEVNFDERGQVHGFGEDARDELYVVYGNGRIDRFALAGGGSGDPIPPFLSQTGIFANTNADPPVPAPGVVDYDVRARLFSDNLDKQRYFAIPAGQRISFSPTGRWGFPAGSVLVKTFSFQGQRIETRVLVRGSDRWRGYTYQWNAAQSDATLVAAEGRTINLPGQGAYDLPSRDDCIRCHNAGLDGRQIIGLQTRQLNGPFLYPSSGIRGNQLFSLDSVGYFGAPGTLGNVNQFEAFADPLVAGVATLNQRAKAYLDQNCGFCHREGGGTPVGLRLEFDEGLETLVGVPVEVALQQSTAQFVVDPGNKENSALWQRMRVAVSNQGAGRNDSMPPISHRQIDQQGVQLIGEWIDRGLPVVTEVATGTYLEGGVSATTADVITIANVGPFAITRVVIDVGTAAGGVVFDPNPTTGVPFSATAGNTGFDGNFVQTGATELTLSFTDFGPGETFTLRFDADDTANGNLTVGAEFAGTTVRLALADGTNLAARFADAGGNNGRVQISLTQEPR